MEFEGLIFSFDGPRRERMKEDSQLYGNEFIVHYLQRIDEKDLDLLLEFSEPILENPSEAIKVSSPVCTTVW